MESSSSGRGSRRIPVALAASLAAGAPADCEIRGELAVPEGVPAPVVHLLLHGATYDRSYWDFAVEPERYSYVHALAARGYATLAIDRIGTGASDHPAPELVTCDSQAHVVSQLVDALRSGALGPAFARVVLVGHSLGSVIAILAATEGAPIDGLVVTGLLHHLDDGLAVLIEALRPARDEDPRFAALAPEYRTTIGGRRGAIFYHADNADPAVIAHDDATRDTQTIAEDETFPAALARSVAVTAPVLVLVGDRDRFFCTYEPCSAPGTGGAAGESEFWSTGSLTVETIADSGHVLNLQRNAPQVYARIADWCDVRLSVGGA